MLNTQTDTVSVFIHLESTSRAEKSPRMGFGVGQHGQCTKMNFEVDITCLNNAATQ